MITNKQSEKRQDSIMVIEEKTLKTLKKKESKQMNKWEKISKSFKIKLLTIFLVRKSFQWKSSKCNKQRHHLEKVSEILKLNFIQEIIFDLIFS